MIDYFTSKKSMKSICAKYGITFVTFSKWKDSALSRVNDTLFKESSGEKHVEELMVENEMLKRDLEYTVINIQRGMRIKERKSLIESTYQHLTISRQCELMSVSQSAYYNDQKGPSSDDVSIMTIIDDIHSRFPGFGVRLINDNLRKRYSIKIGLKRTKRLLEQMNIKTPTELNVTMPEGYLIPDIDIDKPNDAWSIDISYIGLANHFGFLIGIIDWFSRRIVGWRLVQTLDVGPVIETVQKAIDDFGTPHVMNSDNGIHFTSYVYRSVLKDNGIQISFSRKSKPNDNRQIERFFRSLKTEKLYCERLESMKEAALSIKAYIEEYNRYRGHSGLQLRTPDEVFSFS